METQLRIGRTHLARHLRSYVVHKGLMKLENVTQGNEVGNIYRNLQGSSIKRALHELASVTLLTILHITHLHILVYINYDDCRLLKLQQQNVDLQINKWQTHSKPQKSMVLLYWKISIQIVCLTITRLCRMQTVAMNLGAETMSAVQVGRDMEGCEGKSKMCYIINR